MAKYSLTNPEDWYTVEAISLLFPPYNNEHEFRHRVRERSEGGRVLAKEREDCWLPTNDPDYVGIQMETSNGAGLTSSSVTPCAATSTGRGLFYANRGHPECMFRSDAVRAALACHSMKRLVPQAARIQRAAARRCAERLCSWPADPHASRAARESYIASGALDCCSAERGAHLAESGNRMGILLPGFLVFCVIWLGAGLLMEPGDFRDGLVLSLLGGFFFLIGVTLPVLYFSSSEGFKSSPRRVKIAIVALRPFLPVLGWGVLLVAGL